MELVIQSVSYVTSYIISQSVSGSESQLGWVVVWLDGLWLIDWLVFCIVGCLFGW